MSLLYRCTYIKNYILISFRFFKEIITNTFTIEMCAFNLRQHEIIEISIRLQGVNLMYSCLNNVIIFVYVVYFPNDFEKEF